ncbi:MAG: rhomboid family intramembrane serine protease [Spirochaetaceae bacterium]|jgi:membrane associated rhomboid family serine protease|nr:rhomboid family intramembrane serine protease [Spirochaetaceae bacterium]
MRVKYNAPVLLSFVFACAAILFLGSIIPGFVEKWFAVPPRADFHINSPRNWINLFSHVLGHANFDHLSGNLLLVLIVGPMLEDIYKSIPLLIMMLITALVTGVMNVLFGPGYLLGASGIVFMMILLASFTNFHKGEIPLTFILVVVIYLGNELLLGMTRSDNISQFTHIIGGACGSLFGFFQKPDSGKTAVKA